MNRLDRDKVLIRGLDMVDSPELDAKDRPSGTIIAGALSIGWLQDALDLFHHEFPWAGTIANTAVTLSAESTTNFAPADFILDTRDGLILTIDSKPERMFRNGLQEIISARSVLTTASQPKWYTFLNRNLEVVPKPDKTYAGTLWYYQLPAVLGAADVPNFPSDYTLIEYVRIRGLEWTRMMQPGAAVQFARNEVAILRASGLGQEPESSHIPARLLHHSGVTQAPWAWMGEGNVRT